jgi:outer membrane receptor for ferrienterochelin and colicin
MNMSLNHQVAKTIELFGGIKNLLNQPYATFGMLGMNNLTTGNTEQFRGVGVPRSIYAGALAKF